MAASIHARALEVEEPCEWLGFFEWICWSVLRRVRVLMLFASHVVDLRARFAPGLAALPDDAVVHRVAAVRVVEGGAWHSAEAAAGCPVDVNHFVIGVPIAGAAACAVHAEMPIVPNEALDASLAAAKAGWGLKATVCQGDCGVDVMAYHDGAERCADSWKAIRRELATFMRDIAAIPVWQDVFQACQESEPPAGAPPKPKPRKKKQRVR